MTPAPAASPIRFGEKAIELGVLSIDQVEEALLAQEIGRKNGLDRSVGAWLHDRGFLDLVQVQEIMATLGAAERGRLLPDVELVALLGRGTSGAVYRGHWAGNGAEVAVKVRAPKRESDDPGAARFRLEGRLGEKLAHPNIVRLHRAGATRDFLYHVLEYVDGDPLDRLLRLEGTLPERFCASVGVQVCAALEETARFAIVHRDIKPANIMIDREGTAKLCDLGLAKDLADDMELTSRGILLGSPFYLAPEYARTGIVDERSDIYSLGVTLYHCATGAVPFPGKTAMEILQRAVTQEAPEMRSYAPALSEGFVRAVRQMMAKDPRLRFQTAAQAGEALMRVADPDAPPALEDTQRLRPAEHPAVDDGTLKRLLRMFKQRPG